MNAIKSIDCIEPRVSRIQRNLNLNVQQLVPKLSMSSGVGLDVVFRYEWVMYEHQVCDQVGAPVRTHVGVYTYKHGYLHTYTHMDMQACKM